MTDNMGEILSEKITLMLIALNHGEIINEIADIITK
jgi:hypothetical protein